MNWTMRSSKAARTMALLLVFMAPGLASASDLPAQQHESAAVVQAAAPADAAPRLPEVIRLAWDRVGSMA